MEKEPEVELALELLDEHRLQKEDAALLRWFGESGDHENAHPDLSISMCFHRFFLNRWRSSARRRRISANCLGVLCEILFGERCT